MAVFVISFRIGDKPNYSEIWASVDKAVRSEATGGTAFNETTSVYVIKSSKSAADLLSALYYGSDLLESRDGLIVVAGDFAVLQDLIAPLTGGAASLADRPEYQALANALTAYPFVPALMVFDPADLQPDPAPDDSAQALLDANPLLPFELIAIASGASAEPRIEDGVALLVYADAADAETAADAIDARMALSSVIAQASYAELFSANGTLQPAQVITDDATGFSVVMLRMSSKDLPLEDENGLTLLAHRAFSRFMQGIVTRDTLWLTTTSEE